jgi:hypothetical protein
MKKLVTVWATVLAVAVTVAIPALAQGAPDAPDTTVSGAPEGVLVQSKDPDAPSSAPPQDAPPLVAPPPDTTLLDTPLPGSPPPPEDIGEQKSRDEGEANDAVEDQEASNEPVRETGDQGVGSSQSKGEIKEQEVEDRKAGIEKAGAGKAEAGKDGDPKQEAEQDADSGDVDQSVDVVNTGDNVNLCLGVLQAANTGNAHNAQGVVQDDSEADEVELEGGSSLTITPQLIVDCRQIIYQIATGQRPGAGSGDRNALLESDALRGGNVPGLGQLGIGTNGAALKVAGSSGVGLSKSAARRSLPRTGGGALLGLGAGVLLVAGGLAVRKIF